MHIYHILPILNPLGTYLHVYTGVTVIDMNPKRSLRARKNATLWCHMTHMHDGRDNYDTFNLYLLEVVF